MTHLFFPSLWLQELESHISGPTRLMGPPAVFTRRRHEPSPHLSLDCYGNIALLGYREPVERGDLKSKTVRFI